MAYTQIEIETYIASLETALLRGERDVAFSDRRVVYKSPDEIVKSIRYFKGLLSQLLGGRSRMTYLTSEKGL